VHKLKFETYLWKNANILHINYNVAVTLLFISEIEDMQYTQSENSCDWEIFLHSAEELERYR